MGSVMTWLRINEGNVNEEMNIYTSGFAGLGEKLLGKGKAFFRALKISKAVSSFALVP